MAEYQAKTAEQEVAESKQLWVDFEESKASDLEAILTQLETGQEDPLYEPFLKHAVRTEVETRFFETKPASWDASSGLEVATSTIDAGEGGGSGS